MKKIIYFNLIVVLYFISSCQVETTKTAQPFFDITDFFKKEAAQITQLKSIKKIVRIDDKTEEQTFNSFDIKKDLELFKKSNINKMVWLDKYKVDSIFNTTGELVALQYHALDEKLKTRKMIINFNGKEVSTILIKNKSANQVSSLTQDLEYYHNRGYTIKNRQKVSLSDEQFTQVEVTYLNL